jgi:hypothetical protein
MFEPLLNSLSQTLSGMEGFKKRFKQKKLPLQRQLLLVDVLSSYFLTRAGEGPLLQQVSPAYQITNNLV